MTLMEAQACVDELTALRSQLAERDRQIIAALAAELAKLRASNDR